VASDYPTTPTHIDVAILQRARAKHLRLYLEFVEGLPGSERRPIKQTQWERAVVTTSSLVQGLAPLTILSVSGCRYLQTTATNALLRIARVTGYDRAVYGLPPVADPLLFEAPEWNALVATTGLAGCIKGRYGPRHAWELLWQDIVAFLVGGPAKDLVFEAAVAPTFSKSDALPRDAEARALQRGADWLVHSGLLLSESRAAKVREQLMAGLEDTPIVFPESPEDGSHGILEGYSSAIQYDGSQRQRLPVRADCQAESAMLLAASAKAAGSDQHSSIARRLMDFVYDSKTFYSQGRDNPTSAGYGLVAWGAFFPAWEVANYGDDNARVILASLSAAASLGDAKWDTGILRAVAANFRTTGRNGFRMDRIDMPELNSKGWKFFALRDVQNFAPHFESWLWACYLAAYEQTGYQPFLDRTRTGISQMMQAYPAGWRLQDNSERARMLLPLAWLIRVEDTPEHRDWLERITRDLLERMDPCGAIAEHLAGTGGGHYHVPQSNEAYGTGECPLLQENGDPVSDQLYTSGFALLGLHEAAGVSSSTLAADAEKRLAAYLCRIQARSVAVPYLDGAWLRGFDFDRWDYWANSCDAGWGPWCAETGWGHTWIATVLGLREHHRTLWEQLAARKITQAWPAVEQEMLGDLPGAPGQAHLPGQ
jgi:hypothetical protein